jgi:CheY-like chemotaxis protein/nitrogen-specific signal transduction histidine kinase
MRSSVLHWIGMLNRRLRSFGGGDGGPAVPIDSYATPDAVAVAVNAHNGVETRHAPGATQLLASESNSAMARLLAAASHDLRQPLQAIGLWVELLRMQAEGQETRRILGKVHETARGLERVVNSLLEISKLDLGAVEITAVDFPIRELLDRIAATFSPIARARNLSLVVRDSAAIVRSDPLLLERVLSNFVSNGIRHSERGGVLVGCRKRGQCLSLEVWDTGIGIPLDRRAEIFQEFAQLHPDGRDRGRGVGLGLSIAKRIATMLGHPIYVDSRVGKGSCFRVQVPLVTIRDTWRPQAQGQDDAASAIYGTFVVFIDDEKELREAIRLLLNKWGCHAVVAASATGAIAALSEHLRTPDLIITDYKLGDRSTGLQAIRDIRSALDESVPAIIISGERGAFVDKQLAASGVRLLRKPVDPDMLRRQLVELLTNSRGNVARAH